MTSVKNFDDLEIYKRSLLLVQAIYQLCKNSVFIREYSLVDQIKRAALSVPANIAEGFSRRSNKDFANFLSIAIGSANEVIAYLDFIVLQYKLETKDLKSNYFTLTKQIYALRSHLLKTQVIK